MQLVLQTLADRELSQAWLGSRLTPAVRRQSVSGWIDIPERYIQQVANLLGLEPAEVRPDLAALFAKKKLEPERAAA